MVNVVNVIENVVVICVGVELIIMIVRMIRVKLILMVLSVWKINWLMLSLICSVIFVVWNFSGVFRNEIVIIIFS